MHWLLRLYPLCALSLILEPVGAQGISTETRGNGWAQIQSMGNRAPALQSQPRSAQAQRLAYAWCVWQGRCVLRADAPTESARDMVEALRQEGYARAHYAAWLMDKRGFSAAAYVRAQTALANAVSAADALALNAHAVELARLQDTAQATALMQRAAALGSVAAKSNLETLTHQTQDRPSREHIAALMQRTNEKDAQAMYELAQLHHRGEGLPFNQTQAIRLYNESARLGYAPAQRMLGLLRQRGGPHLAQLTSLQFQELARIDARAANLQVQPFVKALLLIDEDPLIGLD
jgi:TPR repeat protein